LVPELPEVETVVRDLRPQLVGRRFAAVRVGDFPLRRPWSPAWVPLVVGSRVRAVRRRGKWILVDLGKHRHLVIHLGMSGQLTVVPANKPLQNHTHIILELDRGNKQLRFRDIRRFGSATLFDGKQLMEKFFAETNLGPEPFELDPAYWRACVAKTGRCLKALLLDQRAVAGVGNIYADESLFTARLHPAQLGRSTTAAEAERLRKAIVKVLRRAIDKRGSSIRNYVGGSGLQGNYQNEFRVYGQTGEPCPRCRTPIQCIRLAGRSTHFCPRCQPPARPAGRRVRGEKKRLTAHHSPLTPA
jgi:formamidopyrimidine-DNA glycosylase